MTLTMELTEKKSRSKIGPCMMIFWILGFYSGVEVGNSKVLEKIFKSASAKKPHRTVHFDPDSIIIWLHHILLEIGEWRL